MSFGSLTVDIDGAPSDPPTRPQLRLSSINRIGSFPSTPYDIEPTRAGYLRAPDVVSAHESAVASLQAEVGRRLAQSKRKEIVFFIHGYNTTFEDAAYTTGKIAHFLGGEFVTIMLSWPAGGSKGLMMGYNVDRESGEFAVPDMKKAIRAIASQAHSLGHSELMVHCARDGRNRHLAAVLAGLYDRRVPRSQSRCRGRERLDLLH